MRRISDGAPRGGAAAVGTAARKTARVLFAVVVVAALCLPAMLPASKAHATAGSLTIAQTHNEGAVYNAVQVFSAEVDSSGKATNLQWTVNTLTKKAVLGYIDDAGYETWLENSNRTYEGAHDNAQNAAEFISAQIKASETIDDSTNTKASSSFAAGLARALANRTGTEVTEGSATSLAQGYYLVTTKPSSVGEGEASTAPIWIAVGATTSVAEKTAVPTVKTEAKHTTDTKYASATDALAGQRIDFRVTATMPSNLGAFDTYPLRIDIDNPRVFTVDGDTLRVYVDGIDVTSQLAGDEGTAGVSSNSVYVQFSDILSTNSSITKGSTVVVEYSADKSSSAKSSAGSVEVLSSLKYRSDPNITPTENTTTSIARVFTYEATLLLKDLSTGLEKTGSTYTIKVLDCPSASDLVGKYLTLDGAISNGATSFFNMSEGGVTFKGLAAGTYEICQTDEPASYMAADSDIMLTIAPTYDSTGAVTGLGATVSGGYAASVTGEGATHIASVDVENCRVNIESGTFKMLSLPVTGLEGRAALYAIAGSLAAAGAVGTALAMRRRKGEDA